MLEKCPNLELLGLMTIGQYGYDVSNGPNPDFLTLKECKTQICEKLDLDSKKVVLSMGMSTDFEHAVSFNNNDHINRLLLYNYFQICNFSFFILNQFA